MLSRYVVVVLVGVVSRQNMQYKYGLVWNRQIHIKVLMINQIIRHINASIISKQAIKICGIYIQA